MSCGHTFTYHSVIPPTHCPKCGRCLGCGQGMAPPPVPYTPWPVTPYPQPWPWTQRPWGITYSTNVTNSQ